MDRISPAAPFNRILISAREERISPASTVGRISPAAPEGRISPAAPEGRISPLWAWAEESAVRADAEFRWRRVGTTDPVSEGGVPGDVQRGRGREEDIRRLGAGGGWADEGIRPDVQGETGEERMRGQGEG